MRRIRVLVTATFVILAYTAGPLPGKAVMSSSSLAATSERLTIPTRHGAISVEVIRPDTPGRYPILFTATPFGNEARAQGVNPASDALAAEYVARGYARAVADTLGTGLSGGCWDWGGRMEQEAAYDTVQALAAMAWSNGKVAAVGTGYEAGIVNALVSMQPPALVAGISVSGVSRWYDYSFTGGVRYAALSEDPLTGADSFNLIHSRVPTTEATSPGFVGNVQQRLLACDPQAYLARSHDESPDYDQFWKDRDYVRTADAWTAQQDARAVPVLFAHGYQDEPAVEDGDAVGTDRAPLADQSVSMFKAIPLDNPATVDDPLTPEIENDEGAPYKRLVLGQWGHGTPTYDEWNGLVRRWLVTFVEGQSTNLVTEPKVQSMNSHTHAEEHEHEDGEMHDHPMVESTWVFGEDYPLPQSTATSLWLRRRPLRAGEILLTPPVNENPQPFTNTGADAEEHTRHHPDLHEIEWLWYATPALKENVRVTGPISFEVFFSSEQCSNAAFCTDAQINAVLVDFHPHPLTDVAAMTEHTIQHAVARGTLDVRYRDGLEQAVNADSTKIYRGVVTLNVSDYMFAEGQHIGLLLQGSNVTWFAPGQERGNRTFVLHRGDQNRASRLLTHWVTPTDPTMAI